MILSRGVAPKAGRSWFESAARACLRVEGLYFGKWASVQGPATKSRSSGASGFIAASGAPSAMAAWHSRRTASTLRAAAAPSDVRLDRPSVLCRNTKLLPPEGRTRTPRPGVRVSHTVYSRASGRRRAMPASVRRMRIFPAMAQSPNAAATVSAASRTIESAKWVYLSVVTGVR